jgi:hypothetical protein
VDAPADIVFLFDVDNTLLDNDQFQDNLRAHLREAHGEKAAARYWEIFQGLWGDLGYADYIGALERYRLEDSRNISLYRTANWLIDYPFAELLLPRALEAVAHVRQWGQAVILSDGDAVFQPHKVARSGLWDAFKGDVLIYIHKELELEDIERRYPARHYVLIDDKTRILAAVKRVWGERVTTVFPRQGHFAKQEPPSDARPVDLAIDRIGDVMSFDRAP